MLADEADGHIGMVFKIRTGRPLNGVVKKNNTKPIHKVRLIFSQVIFSYVDVKTFITFGRYPNVYFVIRY
ncbi:hypothetical protein HMPREF0766_12464 [Sphingobacterium spiritivorum ATCC 33861]|uniref:Uncharacterized protein n=1 Tax=Sphingobacterium spiritivorum ATCC 33861 TaxID=525373 RepID=D7VN94_SPHSI|nr:hypothetical protein HMPREF0766_12464 [Sphingobacterium spiritivorum ATCC 33861]